MRKLSKFVRLQQRDRGLLFKTVLLLAAVKLGLALLPFQTLRRLLAKLSQRLPPQRPLSVAKAIWAIEVASRYMPGGAKCLVRALATQVLLARQGYATQLRIGVAKGDRDRLEAHAWVESQGRVVIGRLNNWERFIPLPDLKN
jgi:Transglutaminase-like superfamily